MLNMKLITDFILKLHLQKEFACIRISSEGEISMKKLIIN